MRIFICKACGCTDPIKFPRDGQICKPCCNEAARKLKEAGICKDCTGLIGNTGRSRCQQCLITHSQKARDARHKLIMEVQVAYGSTCSCLPCGETQWQFLTLDHIEGGGTAHRKEFNSTLAVYRWARKNEYPKTLRLLCSNCNFGRERNGGICPHLVNPAQGRQPSAKI